MRSQTLTEPGLPVSEQEVSRTQPILRRTDTGAIWEYEITMGDGNIRCRSVSPDTRRELWVPITGEGGSISHHPASPNRVSRVMACHQLMESPLAPKSTAIPQQEIASYPREWRDGARSGKYSHIPTYQGWRRGDQPVLAQPEQASQFRPTEWPLSLVPGLRTQAEPIEQPTFEGPRRSSRVRQQRQQPDNVYGDDPFVDRLTDSQWDQIIAGQIPRPSDPETKEKANLLRSYVSCQPVSTQSALELELVLDLLLEEKGDSLRNFLLAAAKRSPPTLNGKTIKGEIELPDPSHIREWTY